jgi:prefoldin beta subunit
MMDPSTNPGHVLASAVDAEIAKFREINARIQTRRNNLQIVVSQLTENQLVFQELEFLNENHHTVYKMIGPVLIKQEKEEARQTVQKRLEYIQNEQKQLEESIQKDETEAEKLAQKIQQMQNTLQQTTAQAVQAIAQHHQQQKQTSTS